MMRLPVTFFGALLVAGTAFAHGESEPGPHGGEIRMPSAFHVEAVAGDDALTVYVLDMQFGNPTTENASVSAEVRRADDAVSLDCRPKAAAFRCPLPDGVRLDDGKLVITASRSDLPEAQARYELPLLQG